MLRIVYFLSAVDSFYCMGLKFSYASLLDVPPNIFKFARLQIQYGCQNCQLVMLHVNMVWNDKEKQMIGNRKLMYTWDLCKWLPLYENHSEKYTQYKSSLLITPMFTH